MSVFEVLFKEKCPECGGRLFKTILGYLYCSNEECGFMGKCK